jgi:predicted RNA-binding Zn-ribbon protein involved in translation (DUF1610 family)
VLSWELPCPYCGGPNEVATDRSCLACKFCGAGLWVKSPNGFSTLVAPSRVERREAVYAWDRYLKNNGQALSRSSRQATLAYVPFWRISAIVAAPELAPKRPEPYEESALLSDEQSAFAAPLMPRADGPQTTGDWTIKPWDLTVPAFDNELCGLATLGIRVETVPLAGWDRVPDDDPVQCLQPTVDQSAAHARYEQTVGSVLSSSRGDCASESIIIAPQYAMIYWPVWFLSDLHDGNVRAAEIDGISGRVIRQTDRVLTDDGLPPVDKGESPILSPHRCPSCGEDLPVDQRRVVFQCQNCQALVAHDLSGRRQAVGADFVASCGERDEQWYPFWAFDAGEILVPAFAIRNYRQLVRFGAIVSGQDRPPAKPDWQPRTVEGTTLHRDVAGGLADLIRERRGTAMRSMLRTLDADCAAPADDAPDDDSRLLYAPLRHVGSELMDPQTGLCMTRSALAVS